MIYDITMKKFMIAMTIFVFLLVPVSYTFAQVENLDQKIEIERNSTEEIQDIAQPSISPILILLSMIGIGLFLSLGYILIKRFNL